MLHGSDGNKMSKSIGNVVLPEEISKKYGIDSARLFLVSMASPDKDIQWSEKGIEGSVRFINKIFEYLEKGEFSKSSEKIESKINKTIEEIEDAIKNFKYNFAVIKIHELFDSMLEDKVSKSDAEKFLKILAPFCPHVCEELWEKLGHKNFISLESWPKADKSKINEKFEIEEKQFEKTIQDILNIINIIKEKQDKEATRVYLYVLPNEKDNYNEKVVAKHINKDVKIFAVNDKNKFDPENKSSKAKPGKPGIYVE